MQSYHPCEPSGSNDLREPTEQYWQECETRLRQELIAQENPSFLFTLNTVKKFLVGINSECGENVKQLAYHELNIMAVCITSKLVFDTPIVYNIDIPNFLCHSYSPGPRIRD